MDYDSSSAMLCSPNKEYSRTRKGRRDWRSRSERRRGIESWLKRLEGDT